MDNPHYTDPTFVRTSQDTHPLIRFFFFFFLMIRQPPRSPLFPYTPLFRSLLWTTIIGTAAIIVYMEMCGRIAVVAREPVFAVIRDRLGKRLGLGVLIASNVLNLIT